MTRSRYAENGTRRRALRTRLMASQDRCSICLLPVDKGLRTPHPESAEVDEIVPVSKGGDPLSPSNVQLAHRCCNQWRSNRPMSYVVSMRREVARTHGGWATPAQFVALAKAAERAKRGSEARSREIREETRHSSLWGSDGR